MTNETNRRREELSGRRDERSLSRIAVQQEVFRCAQERDQDFSQPLPISQNNEAARPARWALTGPPSTVRLEWGRKEGGRSPPPSDNVLATCAALPWASLEWREREEPRLNNERRLSLLLGPKKELKPLHDRQSRQRRQVRFGGAEW